MRFKSILFICALAIAGAGQAHPFHTSLTEIEYNPDSQQLEISVRLAVTDLEEALSAGAGQTVVLDDSPAVKSLVMDYLRNKLRLFSAKPSPQGVARPLPLQWVGQQLEINSLWVFVTVPAPMRTLRLDNALLLEMHPQQINTVTVLHDGKKQSHQLTAGNTSLALVF